MKLAEIKNGIIKQVIVADSEDIIKSLNGEWIKINDNIGIGYYYDEDLEMYVPPKPTNAISFNEESFTWSIPKEDYPEGR